MLAISGELEGEDRVDPWVYSAAIYSMERGRSDRVIIDESAYAKAGLVLEPDSPHVPFQLDDSREFDGVDDYIAVTNTHVGSFGDGDFTVSMWASSGASEPRCLFQIGQAGPLRLWLLQDRKAFSVFYGDEKSALIQSDQPKNVPAWVHVAVVRSKGKVRLHVNGVPVASTNVAVATFTGAETMTIGALRQNDEVSQPYYGTISDVRVYHTGLSPDDVFSMCLYHAERYGWSFQDADRDGLPDMWERWWGGKDDLDRLGKGDTDGDGFSDLEEFQGMTNPTNRSDVPATISFFRDSARVAEDGGRFFGDYVVRKGNFRHQSSFRILKAKGRASEGMDYQWDLEPRGFPRGEDKAVYGLRVIHDRLREPDKMVVFKLLPGYGSVIRKPDTFTLTITSLGEDVDQDGLPDAWERDMFGHLKSGEKDDPDNDGYSNIMEFWKGMKPHIPATRATDDMIPFELLSPVHSVKEKK